MVLSALQICKNIAPNVNMNEVCKEFTNLKAYKAVIDLCVHCCQKIDPEQIAENFYYSSDNTGDQEGYGYYQKRYTLIYNFFNYSVYFF